MFVHARPAPRMTHWVVDLMLAVLAFALAIALTRSASGQEPANKIPTVPPADGYSSMAWADELNHSEDYRTAMGLVRVMEFHRAHRIEAAEEVWSTIILPRETTGWKEVALGALDLEAKNYAAADAHLNEAIRLDPNNPLPHYYRARIRLAMAEILDDRYDDAGPNVEGFVTSAVKTTGPRVDEATLRDEAAVELLHAVDRAPIRDYDRALLNVSWVLPNVHSLEMPLTVPTIDNLVDALGVSGWEADAHWRLGNLMLAKDSLAEAENHWDAATERGIKLRLEYRELAKRHRADGNPMDAIRCKLKSMRFGGPYLN